MQHLYKMSLFLMILTKSYFLVILVAITRKQENKIMNGLLGLKTPLLKLKTPQNWETPPFVVP